MRHLRWLTAVALSTACVGVSGSGAADEARHVSPPRSHSEVRPTGPQRQSARQEFQRGGPAVQEANRRADASGGSSFRHDRRLR